MPKQFLLNLDGSTPNDVDINLLIENNIALVYPTEVPKMSGMVAVEQEPEKDASGIWRQVWKLEPAPPAVVPESGIDILANITEDQKLAILEILKSAV